MIRIRPNIATETSRGRIPPEFSRAGVQDDSLTDHTAVDLGMKMTMIPMISMASDGGTALQGHKLQSCICGWIKITSEKGLKIHQGRKKCLKKLTKGPHIDHYFLRCKADQSIEAQWLETHHSPHQNPRWNSARHSSANGREPRPHSATVSSREEEGGTKVTNSVAQILPEKGMGNRRLRPHPGLKGDVERKLDKMGEIIYGYSAERFGVKSKNFCVYKKPSGHIKSRRQQNMERLVKERRCLRKQWKKASEEERNRIEGDIKQCLAILLRAEHLRKQHKKEEWTRTAFYRDPYKFANDLFVKEKTGNLKVPVGEIEEHLSKIYSWQMEACASHHPRGHATNPTTWAPVGYKTPYMEGCWDHIKKGKNYMASAI